MDEVEVCRMLRKLAAHSGATPRALDAAVELHHLVLPSLPAGLGGTAGDRLRTLLREVVEAESEERDRRVLEAGLGYGHESNSPRPSNERSARERVRAAVVAMQLRGIYCASSTTEYERFRKRLLPAVAATIVSRSRPSPEVGRLSTQVERFIATSRVEEALAFLDGMLADASVDGDRADILAMKALAMSRAGGIPSAMPALMGACELVVPQDARLLGRVITRLMREAQHDEAHANGAVGSLAALLRIQPASSCLWRHYGAAQWYDGQLLGAVASLSYALELGIDRLSALHARGQVLAELGEFVKAQEDLLEVVADKTRPVLDQAYCYSALYQCASMDGDRSSADRFEALALQAAPDNGWHFYRRVLVADNSASEPKSVLADIDRARKARAPAVLPYQLEYLELARARLTELC